MPQSTGNMGAEDTPPHSPRPLPPEDIVEGVEDANTDGLDEEDLVEVIDLDELEGGDDDEEDEEAAGAEGMETADLETAPEDNSSRDFEKHGSMFDECSNCGKVLNRFHVSESVFSCSVHPTNPSLVVSGGEDDLAYLWNAETGDVILETEGFKDSVVQVAFSRDGTYFACADMSGVVRAYKTATKEKVWEFEVSDITVRHFRQ